MDTLRDEQQDPTQIDSSDKLTTTFIPNRQELPIIIPEKEVKDNRQQSLKKKEETIQQVHDTVPNDELNVDLIQQSVNKWIDHRQQISTQEIYEYIMEHGDSVETPNPEYFIFANKESLGRNIQKQFETKDKKMEASEAKKDRIVNAALFEQYKLDYKNNSAKYTSMKDQFLDAVTILLQKQCQMRFISRKGTQFTMNNKSCIAAWQDFVSCINPEANPYFTTIQRSRFSCRQNYNEDYYTKKLSGFITQINKEKESSKKKKALRNSFALAVRNYVLVRNNRLPKKPSATSGMFLDDGKMQQCSIDLVQLTSFFKNVFFKIGDSPSMFQVMLLVQIFARITKSSETKQYFVQDLDNFKDDISKREITEIIKKISEEAETPAWLGTTGESEAQGEGLPTLKQIKDDMSTHTEAMKQVVSKTEEKFSKEQIDYKQREYKRKQKDVIKELMKSENIEEPKASKLAFKNEEKEIQDFLSNRNKHSYAKEEILFADVDEDTLFYKLNDDLSSDMVDTGKKIPRQNVAQGKTLIVIKGKCYKRLVSFEEKRYMLNEAIGKYNAVDD